MHSGVYRLSSRSRFAFAYVCCLSTGCSGAGDTCSAAALTKNLRKHRARAWACEGGGVPLIDNAPWEKWSFDSREAFESLDWKVIRPKLLPEAEDIIWSSEGIFTQSSGGAAVNGGPREWLEANVKPGMAIAIEALHRTEAVRAGFQRQFLGAIGVPAVGVDLYATRVKGQTQVGSYGWHVDTVDALIYVLEGRKRVRVAGFAPGGKISLDRTLGPGSAVYVPGGRFHHVLAMPGEGGGEGAGSEWAKVLSIGFVVANADLLEERFEVLTPALRDKGLMWSAGSKDLRKSLPAYFPPSIDFSDIHAYSHRGTTALHRMVLTGNLPLLQFMLNFANPSLEARTRGSEGDAMRNRTALGVALCCCPWDMAAETVQVLLQQGASQDAVELRADGSARTAREVAEERGLHGLLEQRPEL